MTHRRPPRFLPLRFSRASLAAGAFALLAGIAGAQTLEAPAPSQATMVPPADSPGSPTSAATTVLQAARTGDGNRIRYAMQSASDPLVRKIGLWALADAAPDYLTWAEADQARRELRDWPRPSRREVAAEKLLDRSSMSPRAVIAWFDHDDPQTPQGAMALADALRSDGQPEPAALIIRHAWRTMNFDQATQQTMLYRFHDILKGARPRGARRLPALRRARTRGARPDTATFSRRAGARQCAHGAAAQRSERGGHAGGPARRPIRPTRA